MLLVRLVLVLIVVFVLLVRPGLWPFVLVGLLMTFVLSLWSSARPRAARGWVGIAVSIGAIGGVIAALFVVGGGQLSPTDGDRRSGARPTGGSMSSGSQVREVTAVYVARLTLTGTRNLRVRETLAVPGGPRRSFTHALAVDGWSPGKVARGRRGYVRSKTRRVDVPGVLPTERRNSFMPPDDIVAVLRGDGLLRITLAERSGVVLDAPKNAIGETFPAGSLGPGPGDSTRMRLPLPEFGESVEFDVRSSPFRNAILAKAVDVTVWTPFGWLLGLAIPMISDRARALVLGWIRRVFQRLRLRRSGQRGRASERSSA